MSQKKRRMSLCSKRVEKFVQFVQSPLFLNLTGLILFGNLLNENLLAFDKISKFFHVVLIKKSEFILTRNINSSIAEGRR